MAKENNMQEFIDPMVKAIANILTDKQIFEEQAQKFLKLSHTIFEKEPGSLYYCSF